MPKPSVFRRVRRCVRFCGGDSPYTPPQLTTRGVGALWAVASGDRKSGRFIRGLHHCLQGERGAVTLLNQNRFSRVYTVQKLRRLNKEQDIFLSVFLAADYEFSDNSPLNLWLFTGVTGNVCR